MMPNRRIPMLPVWTVVRRLPRGVADAYGKLLSGKECGCEVLVLHVLYKVPLFIQSAYERYGVGALHLAGWLGQSNLYGPL